MPRIGILPNHQMEMVFLIRQQKYFEHIDKRDTRHALNVLRNELTPLDLHPSQLHELSSYLMCSSTEEFMKKAYWDGVGTSRIELLSLLQKFISPSVMVPQKRLSQLLDQAIQHQVSKCLHHNTLNDNFSYYNDHKCERNLFPRVTTHILEEHSDEIWFLAFSHKGDMLASASKDARAIIWSVEVLKKTIK